MTGRPKLMALRKRIEDDDLEDEIFETVAEGVPIGEMCEMFQITSRKMFYDWKGKDGPRHEKYEQARLIAAEAHAEKAGAILDKLAGRILLTGPEVQLATSRSKYQQWLASVKDRDAFGAQDKGPGITLQFGDLHLEALKAGRPSNVVLDRKLAPVDIVPGRGIASVPEIQEADYEIVETGAGNDGEANAQPGQIDGPITPPAPSLAELGDLL